jgi:hydroxylamine reductase
LSFAVQAVAVLLTLLNLGVKNIRLGPQLPAFCTPDMIDLLVKTFDLKAVSGLCILSLAMHVL